MVTKQGDIDKYKDEYNNFADYPSEEEDNYKDDIPFLMKKVMKKSQN